MNGRGSRSGNSTKTWCMCTLSSANLTVTALTSTIGTLRGKHTTVTEHAVKSTILKTTINVTALLISH